MAGGPMSVYAAVMWAALFVSGFMALWCLWDLAVGWFVDGADVLDRLLGEELPR